MRESSACQSQEQKTDIGVLPTVSGSDQQKCPAGPAEIVQGGRERSRCVRGTPLVAGVRGSGRVFARGMMRHKVN